MVAPSSSALLLIDLQNGLLLGDGAVHDSGAVIDRAALLLAAARAAGAPVLHVQHQETAAEGPLVPGSAAWALHGALAPLAGEPVIAKRHCSAFIGTDLCQRLQELRVKTLVVAGLQTEFCIDTNVRVAQSLGYAVTLAQDAHSTCDTPVLTAVQIIAHHNRALGSSIAQLRRAMDISF